MKALCHIKEKLKEKVTIFLILKKYYDTILKAVSLLGLLRCLAEQMSVKFVETKQIVVTFVFLLIESSIKRIGWLFCFLITVGQRAQLITSMAKNLITELKISEKLQIFSINKIGHVIEKVFFGEPLKYKKESIIKLGFKVNTLETLKLWKKLTERLLITPIRTDFLYLGWENK